VGGWLEHYDQTASGNVASATPSTTVSARGPQASILSVSLQATPRPNIAYQVNYVTQTDQQLTLDSVVKKAGGLPCAQSYELEQQQNQSENELVGPDSDSEGSIFGGPATTSATDTEPAGDYVICTWIEGPSAGEVDAATTGSYPVAWLPRQGPPPKQPYKVKRCKTKRVRRHHHWVRVRKCRTVTVWR